MTADRLAAYAAAYESLTPESLPDLAALLADDVRFKDPFNDFTGRDRLIHVFRRMFEKLDGPRFAVTDTAMGTAAGYLRWTFTFRLKGRQKGRADVWTIEGMSEVRFGADGLVAAHIDHWDAGEQFYARLPVLGAFVRFVARRMAD